LLPLLVTGTEVMLGDLAEVAAAAELGQGADAGDAGGGRFATVEAHREGVGGVGAGEHAVLEGTEADLGRDEVGALLVGRGLASGHVGVTAEDD
jgi:hypothetical protein